MAYFIVIIFISMFVSSDLVLGQMKMTGTSRLSGKSVLFSLSSCAQLPASVAVTPVIDLRAWEYSGSGNWINSGSGGSAYDMTRGNGSTTGTFPTFVGGTPAYFSMDGGDYFRLAGGNTSFIESLHRDGAVYTIVIEAYRTAVATQAWFSTGSWSNSVGVALYSDGNYRYQVGDGSPASGICEGNASLCLNAGSFTSLGKVFMGLSIDEAAGTGVSCLNGISSSFNATYAGPSASSAQHKLELGGVSEAIVPNGTRYYRVRVWNVALTAAQLNALASHSGASCPW